MSSSIAAVVTGPSTNSIATGRAQASEPPPPPVPVHNSTGGPYGRQAFNTSQLQTLKKPAPSFREFFQGKRYPNSTSGLAVPY
jgi:hypothetical protein